MAAPSRTADELEEAARAFWSGEPRVLSVSARRHESQGHSPSDQFNDAIDAVACRFDALLRHADQAVARMESLIAQGHQQRTEALATCGELQERLQVGAHMLKALGVQLARVEVSVESLKRLHEQTQVAQARFEARIASAESQIAKAMQQLLERLEHLSQLASGHIEHRQSLSGGRKAAGSDGSEGESKPSLRLSRCAGGA
jgi:chromosome segregation ATPase